MKEITKYSLIGSLGTAAYVILVVLLIYSLGNAFPGDTKTIFIPITMLMLFVFSAALTGTLVFGKPIALFLEGKKKDALALLGMTMTILLTITLLSLAIMILILS